MKTTVKVAFGDIKFGKKSVMNLEFKGELTDAQKLSLLQFAGSAGFVTLYSAQRDIDDYEETPNHQGILYKIGNDGVPEVDPNQLNFDDVVTKLVDDQQQQEPEETQGEKLPDDATILNEGEAIEGQTTREIPLTVSVQVLKAFTYMGKKLKKNEIIQMNASEAKELDGHVKIVDSTLPF